MPLKAVDNNLGILKPECLVPLALICPNKTLLQRNKIFRKKI